MTTPATTAPDQPAVEPCPLCGSMSAVRRRRVPGGSFHSVRCCDEDACGLIGGLFNSAAEALAAWNRRAPRPSPDAGEIAALRTADQINGIALAELNAELHRLRALCERAADAAASHGLGKTSVTRQFLINELHAAAHGETGTGE